MGIVAYNATEKSRQAEQHPQLIVAHLAILGCTKAWRHWQSNDTYTQQQTDTYTFIKNSKSKKAASLHDVDVIPVQSTHRRLQLASDLKELLVPGV